MFSFFTLILSGCVEKTANRTRSASPVGTVPTPSDCSGEKYWTTPGCTGYCQYQPTAAGCSGNTTGGTTSGSTTGSTTGGAVACTPARKTCSNWCSTFPSDLGCLANGTNCYISPNAAGCPGSSTSLNPQYNKHYPGGEPVGNCAPATSPNTGSPVQETRRATVIGSQAYGYNPLEAGNFLNTSDMLKSVAKAKVLFLTDSLLKIRIKAKPQQDLTGTSAPAFCYGRNRPGTRIPGYTKMRYSVKVYGVSSSNSMSYLGDAGTFETGVNSCSEAIDLSFYKELSPTGVVIAIDNIVVNQGINCQPTSYNGWADCTQFKPVRSFDCWGLDIEIAADGTKTF